MSRRTVCVDSTWLPSGSVTLISSCVSVRLLMGASVTRKFPVAPESITADFLMSFTLKSIVAKRLLAACPYLVLDSCAFVVWRCGGMYTFHSVGSFLDAFAYFVFGELGSMPTDEIREGEIF